MTADWPHGGDVRSLAEAAGLPAGRLLDFSASINPLGPPEWLRRVVSAHLSSVAHYPDPFCRELRAAAAARYGITPDEVVAGNGSSELLYALARILPCRRAVIAVPCYSDYRAAAGQAGLAVETVRLAESVDFLPDFDALARSIAGQPGQALVLLGQPNNPTGRCFPTQALRALAAVHPESWFVIDEAFADFVAGLDRLTRQRPPNVIVLLSLTKSYAVPGLRLGLAVAEPAIAARLRAALPPWSVNTLAQAVGCAALADPAFVEQSRRQVSQWRGELTEALSAIRGVRVVAGDANFVLFCCGAADLAARLLRRGLAIRDCRNFEGLEPGWFRAAVRSREENLRLAWAIGAELAGAPAMMERRRTPAIMFQGVSSNAGKSVLAAGLCRVLFQDGFLVAPFKAQNMSLNSFVTEDGLEMGRAQAVQAQACRLRPDVRMNPVLLKPNTDTGSQVIVRGRVVGNMEAAEYFRFKASVFDEVKRCYDELAAAHDVLVLEGAGSPAEVNLRSHDIVNMAMARHAGAPVLLVGDIDRGGVYAAFIGCMEVFTEEERARVAGFVVNKFRGRQSLLEEAHEYVLAHTGTPVLGVVPHMGRLGLPEEDSVSFKQGQPDPGPAAGRQVEIAAIDLPHISNFTDFDALRMEPDVHLRVVRQGEPLGSPDAILLPGSKNVAGDLRYLFESGLARAILEAARSGAAEIVGICGGFQMLGESVADPHRLESDGGDTAGLGLLPLRTVLEREKTLRRTSAIHAASGLEVRGYEIHHGQTTARRGRPAVVTAAGEALGFESGDGRIWGSYLHGIFDADPFRRWFIDRLRVRRGLPPAGRMLFCYDIEPVLDRLADVLRASLPIDMLYRRMGLR